MNEPGFHNCEAISIWHCISDKICCNVTTLQRFRQSWGHYQVKGVGVGMIVEIFELNP